MLTLGVFLGGVIIGAIGGASAMALVYLHYVGDKEPEPVVVDRVRRELNRCSKMRNVLIIDGHERRRQG